LSYPLMAAIQEISARIERVTGVGIAANLRKNYPKPLLYAMLFVVSVANVFNLGADIGAMGAATRLVLPVRSELAELARTIKDGAKERWLYAAIRLRLGWPLDLFECRRQLAGDNRGEEG
jgi:natural resistance-associated macrophage protein